MPDDANIPRPRISRSICEDVLDKFRVADDTFAGLIESNHLEVRDFIILSFVCDQGAMTLDRIKTALGLSHETAMLCVSRLHAVDLLDLRTDEASGLIRGPISPTGLGWTVTRRIHAEIEK